MALGVALASLAVLSLVRAQQAGTLTTENHPALTIQQCAAGGSCTTQQRAIVLDANWRWVHSVSGSTNCYTGNEWDTTLCPDPVTCATNCALDGANYAGTYGITTSGNSITLDFVTGSNVGSRVYLLETDTTYQEFNLLNQEFTFDVDVSALPCGLNGALYFSQMLADGGTSEYSGDKAGAAYGTGYCDSQCPQDLKFINGEGNVDDWTPSSNNANTGTGEFGSCCNEMDIWEANSISNALTPHVCTVNTQTLCTGTNCGAGTQRYNGLCDKDGCDWNPYRWGDTSFYGPGETVDTKSKFTVITQFITSDGSATGTLTEIRRLYVQNGKLIATPRATLSTLTSYNSITDAFCNAQKKLTGDTNSFESRGGLAALGKAFSSSGMVLVMSLWDDYAANMLWLDSDYPTNASVTAPGVARGTCATSSGVPSQVESQSPSAKVTWSNIKYGALNSTWSV